MTRMLRKALWLVFSLFPIPALVAILTPRDPAHLIEAHWWIAFVVLMVGHYCFFIVHPFFNSAVSDMKRKAGWAAFTLMLYPLIPPMYVMLCIGNARSEPETAPDAKLYRARTNDP